MLRSMLSFFRSTDELDEAVEHELQERSRDDIERAARDPFRFRAEDDFHRFRRRHGFGRRR